MKFVIDKWCVKQQTYGWLVQRKVGKQWKESQFFVRLSDATEHLFNVMLFERTKDMTIDYTNQHETIRLLKELDARINQAADEIKEVLDAKTSHN